MWSTVWALFGDVRRGHYAAATQGARTQICLYLPGARRTAMDDVTILGAGKGCTGASMMANFTTMPAFLSGGEKTKKPPLGLDLDMHADRPSLLRSNVAPGKYDLSQADDYLAKRNQAIAESIATSAKTMTSIFLSLNISRNLRMEVLSDNGWVAGGIRSLFRSPRSIKLIRASLYDCPRESNANRSSGFDARRQSGRARLLIG